MTSFLSKRQKSKKQFAVTSLNDTNVVGCCYRMQTGLRDVCADSQAVPAPAGKHQAEADKRHHQAENGSLHRQRRPAEESG